MTRWWHLFLPLTPAQGCVLVILNLTFLNFNPHLHAIVSDGYFLDDHAFRMAPGLTGQDLEEAFQYEVLKMLHGGCFATNYSENKDVFQPSIQEYNINKAYRQIVQKACDLAD